MQTISIFIGKILKLKILDIQFIQIYYYTAIHGQSKSSQLLLYFKDSMYIGYYALLLDQWI